MNEAIVKRFPILVGEVPLAQEGSWLLSVPTLNCVTHEQSVHLNALTLP